MNSRNQGVNWRDLPTVSVAETLGLPAKGRANMLSVGRHPTASFPPRIVKTVTLPLLYGLAPPGSGRFSSARRRGAGARAPVPNDFPHAEITFP